MIAQTEETVLKRAGMGEFAAKFASAAASRWPGSKRRRAVQDMRALFDGDYYLTANPDLAEAGVDPFEHYLRQGWAEGRNPAPLFNTDYYLEQNPDVAQAGINPLLHFIIDGAREGRDPCPLFGVDWYLDQNPDVAQAGANALLHYLTVGWKEGRNPNPLFEMQWYLDKNPKAAEAGADPLTHYLTVGWTEGRNPNPFFDAKWYLDQNADVRDAGVEPLEHFAEQGWREGRNPCPGFDVRYYLSANPDVQASGGNPLAHYLHTGRKEGRAAVRVNKKSKSGLRKRALSADSHRTGLSIQRMLDVWPSDIEAKFIADVSARVASRDLLKGASVSIVMPTYNRGFCIKAAIESVLSQTFSEWELLIVDDGSADDTALVVEPFMQDPRVRYFRQPNAGVAAARNLGLSLARNDYVAYLDSDNRWRPYHLELLIGYLRLGALDAAYCGLRMHDDAGEDLFYRGDLYSFLACLERNYIDMNTFIHRREIVDRGAIWFDTGLRRLVDWDFILRVTRHSRVSYAPFIGVDYYHGDKGARISLTEYIDGQLWEYEEKIRAKHGDRKTLRENSDRLIWRALSAGRLDANAPTQTLFFYPDYRINNAYQNLLYRDMENVDARPGTIDDCLELQRKNAGEPVVFHLHWTNPIFAPAENPHEAAVRVSDFLGRLANFKQAGGKVLWTVHNVVAHEARYREQELRLAEELCNLSDFIHVHHERVIELASDAFTIPSKKAVVAHHGNYIGALPRDISKEDARKELGIPSDAVVFVMLGQLRAYKGLDELIDAFEQVQQRHAQSWLILAGKPLQIDTQELRERLSKVPNTVLRAEYVPDEEVQRYLCAGDAAVLPYRQVLTSGSALLAMSFGLPVICPRKGLLPTIVEDARNGFMFADEADSLANAMIRFSALDEGARDELAANALAAAQNLSWAETAEKLQRRIGGERFGRRRIVEIDGAPREYFIRDGAVPLENAECGAVVLHYNNLSDTQRCVESVLAQRGDIGLIVLSNAETAHDAQVLARSFPTATIVQNDGNIGYAAGNNIGLRLIQDAGCEFFWIINPDVVVSDHYYEKMRARVDAHPGYALFGSIATFGADPDRIWFGGGVVDLANGGFTRHSYSGEPLSAVPSQPYECDYLTGANIFGRTRVLDSVGLLPEDYFLYFEETDWFMRARKAGERPLVFPDIHLAHWKRSEDGGIPTPAYCYYFVRNAYLFSQRYFPDALEACDESTRAFETAWMEKIRSRAPRRALEFQRLFARARNDGKIGVTGKVNL